MPGQGCSGIPEDPKHPFSQEHVDLSLLVLKGIDFTTGHIFFILSHGA